MPEDKTKVDLGPESLKAFAHPLRMAMYSALQSGGPATASGLARRLGESSGQTSYHLRQLERHGFVEDDPDRSGGRERWWRAVGFIMKSPELMADPRTEPAVRAVLHQAIAERAGTLTAWVGQVDSNPDTWVGLLSTSTVEMTPEEMAVFADKLQDFVRQETEPYRSRVDPPAGVERVRIHNDVFPLPVAEPSP